MFLIYIYINILCYTLFIPMVIIINIIMMNMNMIIIMIIIIIKLFFTMNWTSCMIIPICCMCIILHYTMFITI